MNRPGDASGKGSTGFRKLGLVYKASSHVSGWARHSALSPTPILHRDGHIRVFAGFRDAEGVSRIGFVDLDPSDPQKVLRVSSLPVLDIGRDGCFDDNGMILGDVVPSGDALLMFYVGFQKVAKAKFLAFSGLAESSDGGESFRRLSEAPILGRAVRQTMIAAIHTAMFEDGVWRIWYARGDGWETIDGQSYPRYGICYTEGPDLLNLPRTYLDCLRPDPPEYRVGRPRVRREDERYVMHFTKGTIAGDYLTGKAYSTNGTDWNRADVEFELGLSKEGWDSLHLCYVSVLKVGGRSLMFYNGNDMGHAGFGVAVLEEG